MGEKIAGAPQQTDTRVLLHFFSESDDVVQVFVRFRQGRAFRRHIRVMEGPITHAQFRKELEGRFQSLLRYF